MTIAAPSRSPAATSTSGSRSVVTMAKKKGELNVASLTARPRFFRASSLAFLAAERNKASRSARSRKKNGRTSSSNTSTAPCHLPLSSQTSHGDFLFFNSPLFLPLPLFFSPLQSLASLRNPLHRHARVHRGARRGWHAVEVHDAEGRLNWGERELKTAERRRRRASKRRRRLARPEKKRKETFIETASAPPSGLCLVLIPMLETWCRCASEVGRKRSRNA